MAVAVFTQGSGVRNAAGVFVSRDAGTGARGAEFAEQREEDTHGYPDEEAPR